MTIPAIETNVSTTDGKETGTTSTGNAFTAITTQADLDKVIGDRLARERGKFADYADLKTKADEFDRLAEANKTEIEKATDRVTKAEAEVAKVPNLVADALRTHLIALHKIDADDAELFLTATDPALLIKQVEHLTGRVQDRKTKGNHVPREGRNPTSGNGGPLSEFTRQLFDVSD